MDTEGLERTCSFRRSWQTLISSEEDCKRPLFLDAVSSRATHLKKNANKAANSSPCRFSLENQRDDRRMAPAAGGIAGGRKQTRNHADAAVRRSLRACGNKTSRRMDESPGTPAAACPHRSRHSGSARLGWPNPIPLPRTKPELSPPRALSDRAWSANR